MGCSSTPPIQGLCNWVYHIVDCFYMFCTKTGYLFSIISIYHLFRYVSICFDMFRYVSMFPHLDSLLNPWQPILDPRAPAACRCWCAWPRACPAQIGGCLAPGAPQGPYRGDYTVQVVQVSAVSHPRSPDRVKIVKSPQPPVNTYTRSMSTQAH